eukprot:257592-Chlamydomonas_euryale.AAC.1
MCALTALASGVAPASASGRGSSTGGTGGGSIGGGSIGGGGGGGSASASPAQQALAPTAVGDSAVRALAGLLGASNSLLACSAAGAAAALLGHYGRVPPPSELLTPARLAAVVKQLRGAPPDGPPAMASVAGHPCYTGLFDGVVSMMGALM